MYRIPAVTCPCSASSAGGSAGEMRASVKAETTNDTASAATAIGAENTCTSRPPRLGPPTNDSARLPFRSELARTYSSRGTSDTNNELYAT